MRISHVLASDPATPPHVLAALAAHAHADREIATLLAVHPNLPDTLVPPAAPDHDAHHSYGRWDAEALHRALNCEPVTDHTRTRVLARASTLTLVTYLEGWEHPHPGVLRELAARPVPSSAALRVRLWVQLALRPGPPEGAHLAAVHELLCLPTSTYAAATHRTVLTSGDLLTCLLTQALAHPDHVRTLAHDAHEPAARQALLRYADHYDAGTDPLDTMRSEAATRAGQKAGGWARAITATGDPWLAERALDRPMSTKARERVALAIFSHPALAGTPVWWRAHVVRLVERDVPTGTVTSDLSLCLFAIAEGGPDVHAYATSAPAADPHAPALLAAGWAQLHGGDHTDLDSDAVARTDLSSLVRYALHPAMPEPARRRAVSAIGDADASGLVELTDRRSVDALASVITHAGTFPQLHRALLHLPLRTLKRAIGVDAGAGHLLTWHLARALRSHHAQLDADVITAVIALEDRFIGTTDELISTASAVST